MQVPTPKLINNLSVNIGLSTMLSFFQTTLEQQKVSAENLFQSLQSERDNKIFKISTTLLKSLPKIAISTNEILLHQNMHINKCEAIEKIISIFNEQKLPLSPEKDLS